MHKKRAKAQKLCKFVMQGSNRDRRSSFAIPRGQNVKDHKQLALPSCPNWAGLKTVELSAFFAHP
jgi:hypothetical protein